MPNTIAYSFGDVVLVPFPFTYQTASKKRPAVVVSADAYHRRRPDVIVMAVTSQVLRQAGAIGEVRIADWQGAGLPKESLIKPVLATIEQGLILRELGALQGADLGALRTALRQILGWVRLGMSVAGLVHVERISKSYGRQLAVDGVSFSIAPGEIVGFVGPNGAGKSTTLRVLTGLVMPDSGNVSLDGIDQRSDPTRFRARLGALIEAPAIYPMLSAFEHLAYVARIRRSFNRSRKHSS